MESHHPSRKCCLNSTLHRRRLHTYVYSFYYHLNFNTKSILIVVIITEYIRPICLPSSSEPDYINQPVILTGSNLKTFSSTNGCNMNKNTRQQHNQLNLFCYLIDSASATAEYYKIITSVISNNQCDAVSNNLMTNRMMCTAGVASSGICQVF
jgi:hypothetical protein